MERNSIHFKGASEDSHKCYSETEGDWIVFRCPVCEDYERRINIKTGEMISLVSEENRTPHHGFFIKPGFDNLSYSPN